MTGLTSRLRRAATPRDQGFSLPELMVSITVLSIVMLAVGTVFVGSLKSVRQVADRTVTAADARVALEAVTRSLRVAIRPDGEVSALVSATDSSVTFYSAINRSGSTAGELPRKVAYSYNGGCLNEAITPARVLTPTPAAAPFYAWDTGTVTRCLVRTSVAPVFSYFTTPEISTGGVDNVPLTVPVGGLDSLTRPTVQSVQVSLTARTAGGPTNGATVLDRVTLTNVLLDNGE